MNYLDQEHIIPCAVWYADIPPPSYATNKPSRPFTINISAFDTGPHVLDLYCQYSQSQAWQNPQTKWTHLIPQWRFLDLSDNIIDKITTTDTVIYSGSEVIGVTGYAQFNFIDDIGSTYGYPLVLWATMQVSSLPLSSESYDGRLTLPSYANSKVATYTLYTVNKLTPNELHITRNGTDSMSISPYWVGQTIPVMITLHGDAGLVRDCNPEVGTNMIYTYPSANDVGFAMGPIQKTLLGVPASSQHWTTLGDITSAAYFQAYDSQDFEIRGYSRNKVNSDIVSLNERISATAIVRSEHEFIEIPYVWLSHPNSNQLYQFYSPYNNLNSSFINSLTCWIQSQNYVNFYHNGTELIFDTPFLTQKTDCMSLTGFGGIYSIAVDPCFNMWASDSEMDRLYKFSSNGTILSTLDLSDTGYLTAYGVSGGCTPAGISLDSNGNVWVSLFDSVSVLKINRTTGALVTAINPQGNQISHLDGLGVDPDFKPTIAETDQYNNVWVSYTNSLSSSLKKYDNDGNLLLTVTLPTCSNPMDILIGYDNSVWASLTFHSGPPYLQGSAIHIDQYGGLSATYPMVHPEYMTLDKDNNVWITYGFNNVKKITPTGQLSSFTIGATALPDWYNPLSSLEFNCLEGIACDGQNRIWVINSLENIVYVLSGDQIIDTHTLTNNTSTWYLDTNLNVISVSSDWVKSAQAFGDWTGLRYYQKYATASVITLPIDKQIIGITGASDLFNINTFDGLDVRKFNESWDTTTQIRNYALPEHFYNDENLFINYIGTMVGGLETSANSIGRQIYERTANYVPNHEDVDTSNIPQLYGLAEKINAPMDDYNFEYPSDLKRIMDITSIPHKVLFGDRCKCNTNFKLQYNYCANCGHRHASNVGASIDTSTYVVTANIPFLAEYKFTRGKYEIITPQNSSTNLYTESSAVLLNSPTDYCYSEYIPTYCGVQNEGVISWDDEYTTLSETNSSIDEWYKSGGLVEQMLNYYIHKGLGF